MAALMTLSAPVSAQLANDGANFVEAVRKMDGDKVVELLNKHPLGLLDSRAEDGNTALTIALARRDDEWAGFLLSKGADPNVAGPNRDSPLIIAARVGFLDATEWLLSVHARVDSDNRMGETALIVATQQHQARIARLLIDAGANPDKADFSGNSARDYARRDPRARDILQMIEAAKPGTAAAAKPKG